MSMQNSFEAVAVTANNGAVTHAAARVCYVFDRMKRLARCGGGGRS